MKQEAGIKLVGNRRKIEEKEEKITVTWGLRGNKTRLTETKKKEKTDCQRGEKERTVFPCSKCFLLSPSAVCSGGKLSRRAKLI